MGVNYSLSSLIGCLRSVHICYFKFLFYRCDDITLLFFGVYIYIPLVTMLFEHENISMMTIRVHHEIPKSSLLGNSLLFTHTFDCWLIGGVFCYSLSFLKLEVVNMIRVFNTNFNLMFRIWTFVSDAALLDNSIVRFQCLNHMLIKSYFNRDMLGINLLINCYLIK